MAPGVRVLFPVFLLLFAVVSVAVLPVLMEWVVSHCCFNCVSLMPREVKTVHLS